MRAIATCLWFTLLALAAGVCRVSETSADDATVPADVVAVRADVAAAAEAAPETAACEGGECPEGECQDAAKASTTVAAATETAAPADKVAEESKDDDIVRPTHKQTLVIAVNTADLPQTTLHSFCLTPDGKILAACGDGPGEVRVFGVDGEYIESWNVSVRPEAINVGSDGNVYVAGNGRLLRLDGRGKVLHEAESPHAASLMENKDKLRQEILDQQKQMAAQFQTQLDRYDKLIADLEEKHAAKKEAGEEVTKADERRLQSFLQMKKQYEQMAEQYGAKEPSEEELDAQVAASLDYKLKVASISEADGHVYIACSAAAGYGFSVWKLDRDFAGGEVVVSDLRGCCGQMDVQASSAGIFVAENARHRVACYDKDGKPTTAWGEQSRTGLNGFGSCCNPMNVAFGPDGSIYTAESELGRVKRFAPDGKLIELVGKVDIVPGCKKVAIAVDSKGDNLFMLDISRHHIVKMERLAEGEKIAYYETKSGATTGESGGTTVSRGLLRLILGN